MNHPLHILATLAPAGYAIIAIILFSIWISARICRRREMKGCFTIGYVTLIVFSLMMLCSGMVYMLVSYTAEKTDALAGGKRYTATIVDFDYRENTDDDGNHSISRYPYYSFVLENGEVVTELSDDQTMSAKTAVGDTETIYYNHSSGNLARVGATMIIALIGMCLMLVVFGGGLVWLIMYGAGCKTERFSTVAKQIVFFFLVPFMMIAFDALLVYGLFHGNTSALWVKILLILFILGLTLGTLGYIKAIAKKGSPKFRRVSPTRWEGDWED